MTSVGFLALDQRTPNAIPAISTANSESSGTASVTLPGSGRPAVASHVGDPMVACVFGGAYAGSGTLAIVPDPAWTEVHATDRFGLYTKIADAADVANTAGYTWTYTNTGGSTGIVVSHLSWRAFYGTTLGTPAIQITSGADASVGSPGGRWQLAVVAQRTGSFFPQPEPDLIFVTSAGELIHAAGGNARSGIMKVYVSDNVDPVTATFEAGVDSSACGLMVVPVST